MSRSRPHVPKFKRIAKIRIKRLSFAAVGVFGLYFMAAHPPLFVAKYKVWKAIPGAVVDSQGRSGKLYVSDPRKVAIVVFNEASLLPVGNQLDRYFLPDSDSNLIYFQCLVDLPKMYVTDSKSDKVFKNFLLSRIAGNGWASDAGGIATIQRDLSSGSYLISGIGNGTLPRNYKVKFSIGT